MTTTFDEAKKEVESCRQHRVRRWLIGSALVGAIVWVGSWRVSAGPATGTELNGDSRVSQVAHGVVESKRALRFVTFNMHGGKGRDGRLDLTRIVSLLGQSHFIALNEARGARPWQTTDQVEQLGRASGARWLFAPSEQRWGRDDFGNGIVSRLEVTSWQRIPLPRRHAKGHRNVVLLTCQALGRPIQVLVTHLDRRSNAERSEHLRAVSQMFLALQPPAVLLGDLNTTADDESMQRLLNEPGTSDALAALPVFSDERIDWILVRGLRAIDCGAVDNGASDHPYYWADLQVIE